MFPAEYQAMLPPPARWTGRFARLIAIRDRAANPGERLARALEKLGPAYIKFGQVLATRADVVGADFARGLSRLQDRLPAFDDRLARAAVERELGKPIDQLFSHFGPAVAAASIAQVHKAVTLDGRNVAVKIIRPDIARRMARDIGALKLGARLAVRVFPKSRRLEPKGFVETVARSLTLELDLRLEAASASELAEAAVAADNLNLPEIDWSLTSKGVLTTQWIDALPLTDIDAIREAGVDTAKLAADITDGFLTTALDRGVFHADMHAGNLFVEPGGKLWAVDFGIMGRLGREERRYLAIILHGFLTRDYDRAAAAHFDAGYVPAHHSRTDFASALRAVAEPIFGKTADEVAMSRVLLQLFEITELFDMHLQTQLVLLQKTMVQAEGVCRMLAEQHDMWAASAPAVERFMRRELGPEGHLRDLADDLDRLQKAVRRLPDALDDLHRLADAMEADAATVSSPTSGRVGWLGLVTVAAASGAFAAWVLSILTR